MPPIDVNAIFRPTQELDVDTVSLFAGRRDILAGAAQSLSRPESCVAIFGDRGVGKSSLGRVLMGLLDGRIPPEEVGLQVDRPLPRRWCIRAAWDAATVSLEHLFYYLFDPDGEETRSFFHNFRGIADKIRAKRDKIDLAGLTSEGPTSSSGLGPNQVLVHDMVRSVQDALTASARKATRPKEQGLVIVVDEMDQSRNPQSISKFGNFIKNSRFQFVIIGIGQNIQDILDDHLSAERKFASSQFLVEPLTKDEVVELFQKASKKAEDQKADLSFTNDFCELVAVDFAGYPAQIQSFGLDVVAHFRRRLEAGIAVRVSSSDYLDLLALRETSANRDIRAMNAVDAGIDASVIRWEALKAIIRVIENEAVAWVSLDKLRRRLSSTYQVRLHDHLKVLAKRDVLATNEDETLFKIASPAVLCEIKRRIRRGWEPKSRLTK